MKYMNKRGINVAFPVVIFLTLNIVFFGGLLIFVNQASTGALVYGEAYAKEIALLIDYSKPPMQIVIDFQEVLELASENNVEREDVVRIENNRVAINFGKGGSGFEYFSDYDVDFYFDGDSLVININEREV